MPRPKRSDRSLDACERNEVVFESFTTGPRGRAEGAS
jgi:hypothetical protein